MTLKNPFRKRGEELSSGPWRSGTARFNRNICFVALGLTFVTVTGAAVLTGCGAGGGGSASSSASLTKSKTGKATLTITWPAVTAATKLIPVASNSITATFSQSGSIVATQTVARPTTGNSTTITFSTLPTGTLIATATAFPNTDGSGTAQATASASETIVADTVTPMSITMASTIDHLVITPTAPTVTVGSTTALTETAYDTSSNIVLTSTSITWASSATGIATVSSAGVVTGVAAGSSMITAADSESGKTVSATVTVSAAPTPTPTPSPSATACSALTGGAQVECYAAAYVSTLTTAQQTATVVANNVADAEKWSNLPAQPNSDGTTSLRNGVDYGSLTTAQQTAWVSLVQSALTMNSANGYNQLTLIRTADYYLSTLQGGYSGDNEYVAFVGTPSTTAGWMLQIGGHHNAHNFYFTGTTLNTTTPYHIGVEPTNFTYNGTAYTPLSTQSTVMINLLSSFTTAELASAKLSGSFGDLYLGAGQDARSDFPTGTTGRGILVSNLTTNQQALVTTAIAAWVQNSPLASTYESLYQSELSSTYVGYAGNASAPGTVLTAQGDYIRIDGPHVWIEFVCQNGVVIQGKIHYHTIWRDRVNDYNAVSAGYTLYNHSN